MSKRGIGCLTGLAMVAQLVLGCEHAGLSRRDLNADVKERPGWRMVVVGDVQGGDNVLERLMLIASNLDPEAQLAVQLGDMVGQVGDEFQWAIFHQVMKPITDEMPLYPVVGNHDVESEGNGYEILGRQFDFPGGKTYYRVDVNNAHLIVLDGNLPPQPNAIGGDQLIWLQDQMTALAGDTGFKMVFCHFIFFRADDGPHGTLGNAAQLHALFQSGGVEAVFSGHDHIYNHQVHDGTHYFISGGGGAPAVEGNADFYHFLLVTVGSEAMWVDVITLDGQGFQTVMVPR